MPTSAKKVAAKKAAAPAKKVAAKKAPATKTAAAKKVAVKASGAPTPIKDTFTKASLAAHVAERAGVEPKSAKGDALSPKTVSKIAPTVRKWS